MAETSQTMGVIAMNAVQKKLVRPDIPSCALVNKLRLPARSPSLVSCSNWGQEFSLIVVLSAPLLPES